ncbi:GNAT family N-acetyltransferase [Alteribacter lacisalsi]|nr:GNAT family N-acetyltransferase [Alteribacter lacisalsi]
MTFSGFSRAKELLLHAGPWLEKEEAKHNLPLGLLAYLAEKENTAGQGETERPFLASNKEGTMVMIQTPPMNLIVAGKPQVASAAAKWLEKEGYTFPGITGENELVNAFLKEMNAGESEVFMRQRIYRLDQVEPVPAQAGTFDLAQESDLDLITGWVMEFHAEALSPTTEEEARTFAERSLSEQRIYLWKDIEGIPVSMAKRARETRNGASVNLVFTPDKYKRKGYATSCVAALSSLLLEEGYLFCCLYTDLDNPTSNSIYTKIGYRPVADSLDCRFRQ